MIRARFCFSCWAGWIGFGSGWCSHLLSDVVTISLVKLPGTAVVIYRINSDSAVDAILPLPLLLFLSRTRLRGYLSRSIMISYIEVLRIPVCYDSCLICSYMTALMERRLAPILLMVIRCTAPSVSPPSPRKYSFIFS